MYIKPNAFATLKMLRDTVSAEAAVVVRVYFAKVERPGPALSCLDVYSSEFVAMSKTECPC